MGQINLVTGGARSGKSDFAEQQIWHEESVCYVATGIVTQPDAEFQQRVQHHQERRPLTWETREQFEQLSALFEKGEFPVYLLDCATMLTTNLLFKRIEQYYPHNITLTDDNFLTKDEQTHLTTLLLSEWQHILKSIKKSQSTVWIVTNEVGLGIVPDNRLARFYRDLQGKVNQLIAKEADEVHFIICGLSQRLK